MAKNEVVVNIKGNTTEFNRQLDTLKGKLKEALGANAFSLAEVSPFKFLSDAIRQGIMGIIDAFRNAEAEAAKVGDKIKQQADAVNLSAAEFAGLRAAADAAAVSAGAFADAIDRIKSGQATIADIRQEFERLGEAQGYDSIHTRREAAARLLANYRGIVAAEAQALDEAGGTPGGLSGLIDALTGGNRAQSAWWLGELLKEVDAGRRDYYSAQEIAGRTGDVLNARYDQALTNALNAEIDRRLAREREERERAEAEAEKTKKAQADAEKKAAEAAQRAAESAEREENARNARLARDWGQLRSAGVADAAALDALRLKYGLEGDALQAALQAGQWLNYDPVAEAVAAARGQRSVTSRSPHNYVLDENAGDGLTEGDLNATWLTGSGGSLLRGGGLAALQAGQRMRAISIQERILDKLDSLNATAATAAEAAQQVAENTTE